MGFQIGGLAGWLTSKLRRDPRARPRLALIEKIALTPRQFLVLIEAEGRRFLVAASHEGSAAFYPLDQEAPTGRWREIRNSYRRGRVL